MIGVIVPAHNEQATIGACLRSVQSASKCGRIRGEAVLIVVVLDACTDDTGRIASRLGVEVVSVRAHNVGVARAAGARLCLDRGCRWLAFTDADSEVAEDWLADQLRLRADAVCGTVAINDWGRHGGVTRFRWNRDYSDVDGHRHIHGANLGVSAAAYRKVGGFSPLACSEDVALVRSLETAGASISWSARPRVITSARRNFRAAGGFGDALLRLEAAAMERLPLYTL